tara:strand:- start:1838 stop:2146 length:309 start_codon:yes stop_codon:yes gene_type:complete
MSTETLCPSTFEGFYMKEGPSARTGRTMLFFGKKKVLFPDGNTLLRANSGSYTYPVSGWTWFNSLEEACDNWSLDIELYELEFYGPYYELITGKNPFIDPII